MFDAAPAIAASIRMPHHVQQPEASGVHDRAHRHQGALEAVLHQHGSLARELARVHRRCWLDEEDLVAEGMLGLILAWERYDPSHGVTFRCYARWWVRARIVDFVAVNGRVGSLRKGRVGRRLCCELPKEQRRLDPIAASPSLAEVASSMQVSIERIEEFMRVYEADQLPVHQPVPGTDGRLTWEAVIRAEEPDPEVKFARMEIIRQARRSVEAFSRRGCSERETQIICERILAQEPISLATLGRRWGVSKQRASQIEQRLLRRLHAQLIEDLEMERPGDGADVLDPLHTRAH
jgi:RNA polymerase sigma-32 factor